MKIAIIGTSKFTLSCTQALIDIGASVCVLISQPKRLLPLNSVDINSFAKKMKIPYCETTNINSPQSIKTIQKFTPDYLFSSWPKILKKNLLRVPKKFCIGTHPTALPFNRGRHPLHWLITMGIPHTKLSFFIIDEGIDSGRLLLQIPIIIDSNDTISHLVAKVNDAGYRGMRQLYKQILSQPKCKGTFQKQGLANYWRKKTPHDVTLDMRMSVDMILRIVKSFGCPYPCANLIFKNHVLKIHDARKVNIRLSKKEIQRREHGKVLKIKNNTIKVKAGDGIVELLSCKAIPSSLWGERYIHPPTKYYEEFPKIAKGLETEKR